MSRRSYILERSSKLSSWRWLRSLPITVFGLQVSLRDKFQRLLTFNHFLGCYRLLLLLWHWYLIYLWQIWITVIIVVGMTVYCIRNQFVLALSQQTTATDFTKTVVTNLIYNKKCTVHLLPQALCQLPSKLLVREKKRTLLWFTVQVATHYFTRETYSDVSSKST